VHRELRIGATQCGNDVRERAMAAITYEIEPA